MEFLLKTQCFYNVHGKLLVHFPPIQADREYYVFPHIDGRDKIEPVSYTHLDVYKRQAQNNTQNSGQNNSGTTQNVNVQISEADAKAAALERVPGATEQDLRMELDRDDGKYIYEGDIIYQQKEYEFEIDANTGNFLKWSEERA